MPLRPPRGIPGARPGPVPPGQPGRRMSFCLDRILPGNRN
jgi:hypothetical protein